MSKKRKKIAEFRYYRIPDNQTMMALLGEKWRQTYGRDIDYLHFHNYLEIGYCYEGRGTIVLGEDEYPFRGGGEFTAIPRNYLHTTNSELGNVSYWEYLFVDVEKLLKKMVSGSPGYLENISHQINQRAIFLRREEASELSDSVRKILDIMRRGDVFYQEEAEGEMLAFLIKIARRNGIYSGQYRENTREGAKINNLISRALDYISDHYHERIKVSDIAGLVHISETHFRRIFVQYMGISPLEYINMVRIRSACEYLKKTDDTIGNIAVKCGYFTISTFNRNFQKIMGMSPEEWRKRPENYEQQILRFNVRSEEGW